MQRPSSLTNLEEVKPGGVEYHALLHMEDVSPL
jgi:hypothetical protein